MTWRAHYWSCTRFSDKIRGTPKPRAATGDEWSAWHRSAREQRPLRYWLAETGLQHLQNAANWPLDTLRTWHTYIQNRWIDRPHALTAHAHNIPPGSWRDLDHRILYCLFDALVDHVEIERAMMHIAWDNKRRSQFRAPRRWSMRRWRSRNAGIAHLEWESSLVRDETYGLKSDDEGYGRPTPQAEAAREILALYRWYTETRPERRDPHEQSGWSAYCADKRRRGIQLLESDPEEDAWDVSGLLDKTCALEEAHDAEDEAMLIRLIRVRKSLWA